MKVAAGTRNPRHDGTDGDIEDQCDVLVLELFDIAKEQHFAEGRLKLIEGLVHCCLVVEADEAIFRGWTSIGHAKQVRMVFQKYGARRRNTGTRGEERVAEDTKDPCFEVAAGLKGVERAKSFGDSFLHKVFRVGMIAAQPKCVAVERGQERERKLLERCAIDVRGHGAKFLGVSGGRALPGGESTRWP